MNLQVDEDIPDGVQYSDNTEPGDWMFTEDKTKKWTHTKTKAINVAVTHTMERCLPGPVGNQVSLNPTKFKLPTRPGEMGKVSFRHSKSQKPKQKTYSSLPISQEAIRNFPPLNPENKLWKRKVRQWGMRLICRGEAEGSRGQGAAGTQVSLAGGQFQEIQLQGF